MAKKKPKKAAPQRPRKKKTANKRSAAAEPEASGPIRPSALTPNQMARLLMQAGGRTASVAEVRADIEAGAPTNGDGTLHLIHYTAWLAREAP